MNPQIFKKINQLSNLKTLIKQQRLFLLESSQYHQNKKKYSRLHLTKYPVFHILLLRPYNFNESIWHVHHEKKSLKKLCIATINLKKKKKIFLYTIIIKKCIDGSWLLLWSYRKFFLFFHKKKKICFTFLGISALDVSNFILTLSSSFKPLYPRSLIWVSSYSPARSSF